MKQPEPEATVEEVEEQLRGEIDAALKKQKARKSFSCEFCDFKHKNRYQKVRKSGLTIPKHHETFDCPRTKISAEHELDQEIAERLQRYEAKKKQEADKRTPCPFGCGKSWKSIHSHSVKLHVLQKCPNREGQREKLKGFYKRKSLH